MFDEFRKFVGLEAPGKFTTLPEALGSSNSEKPKEPEIMEIVDNRIYFYGEIYRDKTLKLNRELKNLDNQHISSKIKLGLKSLTPIFIHINSYGGSAHAGFSCMDNINQCHSPIITIVDGVAASAATLLSIVGNVRFITENSVMLIHQVSSFFWGKYQEFEDEKKNLELAMNMLKKAYGKYTKVPEEEIDNILKKDLYFDAQKCVEYGLVDAILTKDTDINGFIA